MRIPILTYQPMHIDGNGYGENDLRALAADLRQLTEAGFRIVPLRSAVDAWLADRGGELGGKVVSLVCDNGSDFDYLDLPHPTAGTQRSVFNVLADFAAEHPGRQPELHITSFAVVSPEARAALDAACMIGRGWWTDAWWHAAIGSGTMHIANFSWDHNHEALPGLLAPGVRRGTFDSIDSRDLADREIRHAAEYLRERAPNPGIGLFAYPYGASNSYLVREYFPRHAREIGIVAAFTDRAGFFETGCGRWEIPRFACGRDWTSPGQLQAILDAAADPQRVWSPVPPPVKVSPPRDLTLPRQLQTQDTEEFFQARYGMVPRVVNEWMRAHGGLAGLDILDFGCGEAIAALGIAQNYAPRRVVGVDIGTDPEHCLPVARAHTGLAELPANLELHRVTPGFLHDPDDRFDLVYSWSVFEHVDERLIADVLRLIKASLKPDGLLLVQIAPLYYSAEGSHLTHRLPEPWGHLLHQHDVFHERLKAAVPDQDEQVALWGTYTTLNRMTADELIGHLEKGGFEVVRKALSHDGPKPPARLKAIFREEILTNNQVVLLARPRH